jgi:hypothetical protein
VLATVEAHGERIHILKVAAVMRITGQTERESEHDGRSAKKATISPASWWVIDALQRHPGRHQLERPADVVGMRNHHSPGPVQI